MSELREVSLDEVVKFQRGHDLTVANIEEGEYPVAGSNGVIGFHNQFTTEAPGITLGRSGNSIGVAHYYEKNFWAHNMTLYSTEFLNSWPRYVYYFLRTIDFSALNSGSAVPSLNRNHIHSIKVRVPDLPKQKAIAAVLSSLDDKIALLLRQNRTLEAMAETLFRQWFVEEVQEDCKPVKVNDFVDVLSGFAFKSGSFIESGAYRLITIKAVQDGYLELAGADRISEVPSKVPDYCYLKHGDILLSLTGNVGRCCLIDDEGLLLNQRVAKLRARNERDWAFAYVMFRQSSMKQYLEEMAKGTAQANLSPIETANMEVSLPSIKRLELFSAVATPILERVLFNKNQIRTLEKLRDTLLPKLMSGEVRVV